MTKYINVKKLMELWDLIWVKYNKNSWDFHYCNWFDCEFSIPTLIMPSELIYLVKYISHISYQQWKSDEENRIKNILFNN